MSNNPLSKFSQSLSQKKRFFPELIPFYYFLLIIFGVTADQLVKSLAMEHLQGKPSIMIFSDILTFRYVENTGIAFGFPLNGLFLQIVTASLITLLIWYFYRNFRTLGLLERTGFAGVISGALGNGYDRLLHGTVVDFISLKYFAIFNVADIVISIGALLIILSQFHKNSHGK